MRYQVTHRTSYEYDDNVTLSQHALRLIPRDLPRQRRLQHNFHFTPEPALSWNHTDYYGNTVVFLTLEKAHRGLEVVSLSMVDVDPVTWPEPSTTPPWEQVRAACNGQAATPEIAASEFVFDSPLLRRLPPVADYAVESFAPARPVLEAVLELTRRIHGDFTFDPKATTVATPLDEVLQLRRGVCQDFAHLQIACLRAMGVPARYVSGYLETLPPPGQPKLAGADASHAWCSFFCPGLGWIDVDPTNNLLPSDRHVTIGWGRDYSDVSPIRGVILGAGEHSLTVNVDVTALEDGTPVTQP